MSLVLFLTNGINPILINNHILPPKDKYDMVQAICYIMCKSESEGTSHRGLMSSLGIYPAGFWITELMDVHNALWTEYQERESKNFEQS